METFIPTFDWQQVVVLPWKETGDLYIWVFLMGFLVTMTCGLVGNYLILRRMALVGDAISHSVLPGLAVAFIFMSAVGGEGSWIENLTGAPGPSEADELQHGVRYPTAMFFGALLSGILTTLLIEVIHKKTRIKQDAAIGITFTSLFAIGVILISVFADRVHLDTECVLYGEITYIPYEPYLTIGDKEWMPQPVFRMGIVALITILLILCFYKELLVSSFDPGLASSLGIPATLVHYALMSWLSVIVVSAFQSVGAILVIAMLIFPGATASLLSDRLPRIMILTCVQAALSAFFGLHLGLWLECSTAGAMVVVSGGLFLVAWIFSPRYGLISQWVRHRIETSSATPPEIEQLTE